MAERRERTLDIQHSLSLRRRPESQLHGETAKPHRGGKQGEPVLGSSLTKPGVEINALDAWFTSGDPVCVRLLSFDDMRV